MQNDKWIVRIADEITAPIPWHQIADMILDGVIENDMMVRQPENDEWISISETRLAALFFNTTK